MPQRQRFKPHWPIQRCQKVSAVQGTQTWEVFAGLGGLTEWGWLAAFRYPDLGFLNCTLSSFFSVWVHFVCRDVRDKLEKLPQLQVLFCSSEWAGQEKKQAKIIFLQCSTPASEGWCSAEDLLTVQLSLLKGTSICCFLMGRIALSSGHCCVLLQLTQSSCRCHVWKTEKLKIPCSKSSFYLVLPDTIHDHKASSGMWPWELSQTVVLFAGCLPLVTTVWSLCFPHWSWESLAHPWNSSSAFTAMKSHRSWSKRRFIQEEGLNPIRAK